MVLVSSTEDPHSMCLDILFRLSCKLNQCNLLENTEVLLFLSLTAKQAFYFIKRMRYNWSRPSQEFMEQLCFCTRSRHLSSIRNEVSVQALETSWANVEPLACLEKFQTLKLLLCREMCVNWWTSKLPNPLIFMVRLACLFSALHFTTTNPSSSPHYCFFGIMV